MNYKIVSGKETDKWLPKILRKSTFPILHEPAKTYDDISGSAFLLHYHEIPYIVTAKHVVESENPSIAFAKKDRTVIAVKTSELRKLNLQWIFHPAGLDLAAIPFHLPLSIVKQLDIKLITENMWALQTTLKISQRVAHLGFPDKGTSTYSDGFPSVFPQAMRGEIIDIKRPKIILESASTHGASGGPVFLRRDGKSPLLIGTIIEGKFSGKITRPDEQKPLNKTTFLPISLVKDILESDTMKKQYENRIIPAD